jgi:xanthine dehydrogenase YagT iron-sulfur-binding subunit
MATAAPLGASAQPAPVGAPVINRVSMTVNGEAQAVEVDTRTTLLDLCASNCNSPAPRRGATTASAAPAR